VNDFLNGIVSAFTCSTPEGRASTRQRIEDGPCCGLLAGPPTLPSSLAWSLVVAAHPPLRRTKLADLVLISERHPPGHRDASARGCRSAVSPSSDRSRTQGVWIESLVQWTPLSHVTV
jgi:hypothetical protein